MHEERRQEGPQHAAQSAGISTTRHTCHCQQGCTLEGAAAPHKCISSGLKTARASASGEICSFVHTVLTVVRQTLRNNRPDMSGPYAKYGCRRPGLAPSHMHVPWYMFTCEVCCLICNVQVQTHAFCFWVSRLASVANSNQWMVTDVAALDAHMSWCMHDLLLEHSYSGLSVSFVAGQEADEVMSQVQKLRTQLCCDNIDAIVTLVEQYPRQVPTACCFVQCVQMPTALIPRQRYDMSVSFSGAAVPTFLTPWAALQQLLSFHALPPTITARSCPSVLCIANSAAACKQHRRAKRCTAACSLLDAELVQETLDELSRLMPKSDPKQTLLRNPSWVTKVERGPKRLGPHPDS